MLATVLFGRSCPNDSESLAQEIVPVMWALLRRLIEPSTSTSQAHGLRDFETHQEVKNKIFGSLGIGHGRTTGFPTLTAFRMQKDAEVSDIGYIFGGSNPPP